MSTMSVVVVIGVVVYDGICILCIPHNTDHNTSSVYQDGMS